MATAISWTCPFCNHTAFIRSADYDSTRWRFRHSLIDSHDFGVSLIAIFCPNLDCQKFTLSCSLIELERAATSSETRDWDKLEVIFDRKLVPESAARVFPDYIPKVLLDDYREACLIVELSPKASATLSRRCLQGMIRDFWGIRKSRLKDEIDALQEKVESSTWGAIDAVRSIGNIGAHMESDINLIVDVEPDEADLLIGLIETLFSDWYVARHAREERMAKIRAVAAEKQLARSAGTAPTPTAASPDAE